MSARNCTAWWSSGDGRCSDDDSGAGRHACRLTDTGLGSGQERVHTTCECRCGATAKRPESTLPENLGSISRATVRVDERGMAEETAKALEMLGWSGPDTELLRRRDLQEALGGLGTVLREWDSLLEWVRRLADYNTQLLRQEDSRLSALRTALRRDDADWDMVLTLVSELRRDMDLEYGS